MLLFGNKLFAGKKADDDNFANENEDSEVGSSMVGAQKDSINVLSKHEKLLLLELQRTRLNIVEELQTLDPQISSDNWNEVQDTIATYQDKITNLAGEETIDGQKMPGRFNLPGSPPKGHTKVNKKMPPKTSQIGYVFK